LLLLVLFGGVHAAAMTRRVVGHRRLRMPPGSVLLLLATTSTGAHALVWHPVNPKNQMFDTWLLVQPSHSTAPFYMNYLSACDESCGGSYDGQWNGVGAAISTDGVHFADEGVVIHKVGAPCSPAQYALSILQSPCRLGELAFITL
jgi:hypothetical protein